MLHGSRRFENFLFVLLLKISDSSCSFSARAQAASKVHPVALLLAGLYLLGALLAALLSTERFMPWTSGSVFARVVRYSDFAPATASSSSSPPPPFYYWFTDAPMLHDQPDFYHGRYSDADLACIPYRVLAIAPRPQVLARKDANCAVATLGNVCLEDSAGRRLLEAAQAACSEMDRLGLSSSAAAAAAAAGGRPQRELDACMGRLCLMLSRVHELLPGAAKLERAQSLGAAAAACRRSGVTAEGEPLMHKWWE